MTFDIWICECITKRAEDNLSSSVIKEMIVLSCIHPKSAPLIPLMADLYVGTQVKWVNKNSLIPWLSPEGENLNMEGSSRMRLWSITQGQEK